jgi:hypothetical protein
MLRLAADENFNGDVVRGLRRRQATMMGCGIRREPRLEITGLVVRPLCGIAGVARDVHVLER